MDYMKYIYKIAMKITFMIIMIIWGILLLQNIYNEKNYHIDKTNSHKNISSVSQNIDDCDCCDDKVNNHHDDSNNQDKSQIHKKCPKCQCSCSDNIIWIPVSNNILWYVYKIIGKIYISDIIWPKNLGIDFDHPPD